MTSPFFFPVLPQIFPSVACTEARLRDAHPPSSGFLFFFFPLFLSRLCGLFSCFWCVRVLVAFGWLSGPSLFCGRLFCLPHRGCFPSQSATIRKSHPVTFSLTFLYLSRKSFWSGWADRYPSVPFLSPVQIVIIRTFFFHHLFFFFLFFVSFLQYTRPLPQTV